jgi:hypothetical protein
MTIETVVGEAGLSLASYNAYRRHENLPRADEALEIAQALGTTVEHLVSGAKPGTEPLIAHAQALLDGLKKL